jgi:hypothetical protein
MAKTIINISNLSDIEKTEMSEQAIKRVQNQFNLELQKQAFHKFYMQ